MKNYLFTMRHAPQRGSLLQERLDIILTAAAFDQKVGVLFMDDGVFQLKSHQQTQHLGLKDTLAIFKAFGIYDIQPLFVEVESLQERGLKPGDLALPAQEVYRKDIAGLQRRYDIIY